MGMDRTNYGGLKLSDQILEIIEILRIVKIVDNNIEKIKTTIPT